MQINEQALESTALFAYGVAQWLSDDREASDKFLDYCLKQSNGANYELSSEDAIAIHEQHIQNIVRANHQASAILHIVTFNPPAPDFNRMFPDMFRVRVTADSEDEEPE